MAVNPTYCESPNSVPAPVQADVGETDLEDECR